jgi:hypothetical protein
MSISSTPRISKRPLLVMTTSLMVVAGLACPEPVAAKPPAAGATATSPQSRDGRNRRVRIHNQTGWTMVGFQIAEARSRAWQGDVLGAQAVATGASWVTTIDDGSGACVYLLRAEFSNGQSLERGAINVCEIADYYYTR